MARPSTFEGGLWVIRTSEHLRFELHWSLPLFPLLSRCWAPLSFVLALVILAAHEIGHAIVVRWRGRTAHAIRMHGLGGHCLYDGGTALDEAWIAWGGVAAQFPFLVVGLALVAYLPDGSLRDQLWMSLVFANTILLVLNLLPVPGLDGGKAWGLFSLLRRGKAEKKASEDRWAAKDRAMWEAIERAKRRQSEKRDANDRDA